MTGKAKWLSVFLLIVSAATHAQHNEIDYNSIRIAYFQPSNSYTFQSVGDQFIQRARASHYNYIVVPFTFRGDGVYGNGDVYVNLENDVRDAFAQTRGTGIRLIPHIAMSSRWAAHWATLRDEENRDITVTRFEFRDYGKDWVTSATNCWANDPEGVDESFIDVLNAIRRGHEQAHPGYPFEFIHLGHDEPQAWNYSLVGYYPFSDQFSLCYGGSYSIRSYSSWNPDVWYLDEKRREYNDYARPVQDLMSNEIHRRITQVQSVFGSGTRVMIYGDSWDFDSWGGVYMYQYYTGMKNDKQIKIQQRNSGLTDLPGLTSPQKNLVRENLVLLPWNYTKRCANRGAFCLTERDYSASGCFATLANSGFKFVYGTDVNAGDKNSDAAKRYRSASLSCQDNCVGYCALSWGAFNPSRPAADYNTMEVLYSLNQSTQPVTDYKSECDLLFFEPGNNTIHVTTSTGSGFFGPGSGQWVAPNGFGSQMDNYYPGDFNGDGRTDLGYLENSTFYVRISTGRDFNGPGGGQWVSRNGFGGSWGRHYVGDFSGDGRDDLLFFEPSNNTIHVSTSTGTGFGGANSGRWIGLDGFGSIMDNYFPADYNGDGITDLGYLGGNNTFHVVISTGAGFNGPGGGQWVAVNGFGGTYGRHYVGDFNGDGRDDLLFFEPSNNTIHVSTSTGTGFGGPNSGRWIGPNGFGALMDNYFPADFNQDGVTDLGYLEGNSTFHVTLSSGTGFGAPGSGQWIPRNGFGGTHGRYYVGRFSN